MASNPDFFRRWLHSEEAKQGCEEIYRHTHSYIQREGGLVANEVASLQSGVDESDFGQNTDDGESSDQPDTAMHSAIPAKFIPAKVPANIVNSSVTWSVGAPCKCHGPCKCESCYTTIQYKNLTIMIYGEIPVGINLISLCIYEVSHQRCCKIAYIQGVGREEGAPEPPRLPSLLQDPNTRTCTV